MEKTLEQLNAESVDPKIINDIECQRKRVQEYPPIGDQLDMLWHMMDEEIIPGRGSDWFNAIASIKQKFPKNV
jgi:hypothetical protein